MGRHPRNDRFYRCINRCHNRLLAKGCYGNRQIAVSARGWLSLIRQAWRRGLLWTLRRLLDVPKAVAAVDDLSQERPDASPEPCRGVLPLNIDTDRFTRPGDFVALGDGAAVRWPDRRTPVWASGRRVRNPLTVDRGVWGWWLNRCGPYREGEPQSDDARSVRALSLFGLRCGRLERSVRSIPARCRLTGETPLLGALGSVQLRVAGASRDR